MNKGIFGKMGESISLTTAFSVAASLIPANIAYHGMQAFGASMTHSNAMAEFTGVMSAAMIAATVSRHSSRTQKHDDELPRPD